MSDVTVTITPVQPPAIVVSSPVLEVEQSPNLPPQHVSYLGLKGEKGDTGFSAYQIAVENGYVGTEGQWDSMYQKFKIEKYTAENQLPTTGRFNSVYFLNVAGSKYLKYWDGTAYVNASTKTDLPKCVSSIQRDYYATFSDISTANYNGRNADICVISDETQSGFVGLYFFDGSNLIWKITQ